MKIKLSVFFIFFILITQVGAISGEKALQLADTLPPIEKMSSKKTLVDPLAIKEYVKQNFAFTELVNAKILNVGVNDIYFIGVGSEKYVLRLSRADKNLTLTDSSFLWLIAQMST